MQIDFADSNLPSSGTVVVLAGAGGALGARGRELDDRADGALRRVIERAGGRFKRGRVLEAGVPAALGLDRVLVLALGDPKEASVLDLEGAGGSLAVRLRDLAVARAALMVDAFDGAAVGITDLAVALATGVRLRAWRFTKYRSPSDDEPEVELEQLSLLVDEPEAASAAFDGAAAVIEGALASRDLVTEPANVLSPKAFAEACRELGETHGLDVQVLEPPALRELGMNTLLAVAQGSAREGYVAVMRWPGGPPEEPPVALVGKGVCFDSGGISIKPAAGMEEMKWDMGGAAAVFGTMKALAARKAKVNVVGVLGLVENMPSGTAQRPGDVVRTMSGVSVEVINTDAEGRLVLADALHYTIDRFKPKVVVDLATLTGAIIVALGHEQAGLFTSDDKLAAELQAAGAAVGEKLWRMPIDDAYAEHIKSDIADIKNTGRAREAGATAGAMFLKRFVGDLPWAHLDIAGTTWTKRDLALAGKGATGFGVRLLERWIADTYER